MILSLPVTKEQKKALLLRYSSVKFFLQKAISNKANEIMASDDLEKELQEYHDRRVLNGYNIRRRKMTQATKDKISLTLKEKYKGTEHHLFKETRVKIGLENKGKVLSKETKDKIGKAHKGMKYKKHKVKET